MKTEPEGRKEEVQEEKGRGGRGRQRGWSREGVWGTVVEAGRRGEEGLNCGLPV